MAELTPFERITLQVQALEMSELRVLSTMAQGGAPGPEVSTLKVRGSEIQQRIAELTMEEKGLISHRGQAIQNLVLWLGGEYA